MLKLENPTLVSTGGADILSQSSCLGVGSNPTSDTKNVSSTSADERGIFQFQHTTNRTEISNRYIMRNKQEINKWSEINIKMATTKIYTQCTSYEFRPTQNPVLINSTHRFHTSCGGSHNHTGLTPTDNMSQHQSIPKRAGWLTDAVRQAVTAYRDVVVKVQSSHAASQSCACDNIFSIRLYSMANSRV